MKNFLLAKIACIGCVWMILSSPCFSQGIPVSGRVVPFFYFDLVRFVGKVPLFDQEATPSKALSIPRSPVAEEYNLIIADLKDAINKLPSAYPASQKEKATKFAAEGILALVYLTRSGPNYNIEGPGLATNDYAAAITLLNDITASGKFGLQPTYASVFSYIIYPIPLNQLSVNPGLYNQNPGY